MYNDKTLVCKDCGQEFTFTAGEQEFYAEKGFTNEPQRCKACRDARKGASGATAAAARCMTQSAPSAAEPARFPLNPAVTARSIAATVSEDK